MTKMHLLSLALLSLSMAACAPATKAPASTPVQPVTVPALPPAPTFRTLEPASATPIRTFIKAEQVIDASKVYRAILNTSKGQITLELYPKLSPVAVNNFVFLALNHFYDGTRFHRVIEGFMAQGGDPLSADLAQQRLWGTGGPGYQFSAEIMNGLRFDSAGVLGMARSASLASQGSQFFITFQPTEFLSGQYTVFGRVIAGQDVLNSLTRTYTPSNTPIPGVVPDLLNSVQIQVQN